MINGFDGVKGRWKVNDFTAAPILNYAVCSHATETNTPSDFRTGDAGILAELVVQSGGNRLVAERLHLRQRRGALLDAVQLRQV